MSFANFSDANSKQLDKKVAIVTGAASGIGRAIADAFATQGCTVAVADISQVGAQTVAENIVANGGKAISLAVDVTHEGQVEQAVQETLRVCGGVDILVSNAGIQHIDAIDQLAFEHWKKMLAIHLDGAFLMTRACLKAMYQAKKGGSIIYMGSVHSKEASVLKAPYVTAKHGLLGLCKTVAKEGAPHGVRANVICPGFVRTPLVEQQIPVQAKTLNISEEEVIQKVLLGKTVDGQFTSLADIAELALFFAAFPNNALTGQSLIASHGWFME